MMVYYLTTFLSLVKVSCTLLCPTDLVEWNNRADSLKCDNQKSEFYHCMLDSSSKLVEICMQHALIKPGADPACFIQASNRTSYRTEKLAITDKGNKQEIDSKTNRDLSTTMIVLIIVAAVFALTNLLLIAVIIWQRRKITTDSVKTFAVPLAEEEQETLNS